ncbi:hypothetical protein FEM48_Zijuj05G0160400 [Ziziphus jujuba var. spinosa]|uniref:Protein kinase domain-containing protein n=1 Tax=Ziziphus jujuba var. spinosa TaxID=714518 RepID=A0A978VFS1_ZIZJJ|nr:hypothetical protein FEM48_Zijuj05G0160400 [Ziziphus jujuba var. spinosa]
MKLRRMKDIPVRGAVRAVQWKIDCKEISVHSDNLLQEIDILRRTDSPYVARCHAVFEKPSGDILFLMEYMDCGSFETLLKSHGTMFESNIADVARHVTKGLHYLHSKKIVHRDIKPANLLVNSMMEVKVADFRVSKIMGPTLDVCNSFVGTRAYMSPERFDPDKYELRCRNNSFHGSLPMELTRLWRLKLISFGFNNLMKGEIPSWFGLFLKLETLNLYGNQFIGSIPTSIFNLSSLQIIALFNNQLSEIPTEIGKIDSLELLSLQSNRLTGPFPLFMLNISSLKNLSFTHNNLLGSLPNNICQSVPRLQALTLAYNQLSGFIPSQWWQCKELRTLELSLNHFVGSIPRTIGNLTMLKELGLGSKNLTGVVPNEIGDLQNLEVLVLQVHHLNGPMPPKFFNISSMRIIGLTDSLVDLFLANNKLSGSIPECLGNLDSLRTLSLNSTIPNALFSLVYILKLNLSSNSLVGSLPLDIENMKVVIAIDLSNNELSGNIPSTIGSLQNLINLSLAQNRFTGQIPTSFGELISIELMDLSKNNLSGEIPKSLEALLSLKHFNVSYNQLEGEIPTGGPFLNFSAQSFLSNNGLCGASRLQVLPCKREETHKSRNPTEAISVLRITLPVVSSIILILARTFLFMRYKKVKALKLSSENAMMTQTKTLATIGYMAPEVADKELLGEEKEDRPAIKDCLASFMDLALNCSSDTPEKRKTMKDVLISLHKTKKKLLKEIQSI